ncbi:MAG: hypothetical protein LBI84_08315 [Propionibacteriaceae bacterium]|jgi:hypothetical protein|nr:hypothetical protein [Propionibacteriaceae bacterium]
MLRWLFPLAVVLALAGCGADDHGLPSLGGGASASADTLEAKARNFFDCLRAAELPAVFNEESSASPAWVSWEDGASVLWMLPGGSGGGSGNTSDSDIDGFFNRDYENSYALLVDGVDQSEVFAACHESTGYDEDEIWGSSGGKADPSLTRAIVDAANEWAACARENGWPTVKDAVTPVAQDQSESPMALLPPSITEDQLRQLLAVCPSFDAERDSANTALVESWDGSGGAIPDGYKPPPSIGFDYPGFDGKSWPSGPLEEAAEVRLGKLQEIIYEALSGYWEDAENSVSASADDAKPE